MSSKVYFFLSGSYLGYDRVDDQVVDGFPRAISGDWPGMDTAGFDVGIDAAVNWMNGKLFFFHGNQYVRYDLITDQVDPDYPKPIADNWPGFKEVGFDAGVDASVNWGNGKAFFFRGTQYLRYDLTNDKVDPGFPLPIADHWPGLKEAGFDNGLEGVINWGSGKAYFFRGNQYLRYDIASDRADAGPLPIAGNWPGLDTAGFGGGISSVVDVVDMGHEIWLDNAEVMRAPVNGPQFLNVPWRGVLHTTEGSKIDGALQVFHDTNFWPHFTIEPNTLRVVQYLPLTIGARALSDHATPENAAHAIQIEIVGFATQTPDWAPEQLAFIRDVMRQIMGEVPIPKNSGRTFLNNAGVNAQPGNRMSVNEWNLFSGWCGHQHVPGESHWDPGAIDIGTLLG